MVNFLTSFLLTSPVVTTCVIRSLTNSIANYEFLCCRGGTNVEHAVSARVLHSFNTALDSLESFFFYICNAEKNVWLYLSVSERLHNWAVMKMMVVRQKKLKRDSYSKQVQYKQLCCTFGY